MHQTPVPPGQKCSITQASEPAKREEVRTISQEEQTVLEQAPNFATFCAWLYRLAQAEVAKRETPRPPEAA
ncbi:MAG TPA: hypothetical protein VKT82_01315 [Ktedonobacterales bacterium]|nr:hypothetical protein [Ktedonobacterales bacterium]